MYDDHYRNYKNFCEQCGGLLNSRKENWLIFKYPLNVQYARTEIITCKTCFSFLAEEFFSRPIKEEFSPEVEENQENQGDEIVDIPLPNADEQMLEVMQEDTNKKRRNFDLAYRYTQKEITYLFKANIKVMEMDLSGNTVNITDNMDVPHMHAMCTLCHKNITNGDYIHDCIMGFIPGKIHPEMNPDYLVNTPFWKEPLMVQQENIIYENSISLPFYSCSSAQF